MLVQDDVSRQGIEHGIVAMRRTVQCFKKRAEEEQCHVRSAAWVGCGAYHAGSPEHAILNILALCAGGRSVNWFTLSPSR